MVKKLPNAKVAVEVIGRTAEYNDIVLLKMTKDHGASDKYFRAGNDKYEENEEEKKIIFIVQGLSVMGAKQLGCLHNTRHFFALLTFIANYLDSFDIYLIPMANPDGFAYSYHKLSLDILYYFIK